MRRKHKYSFRITRFTERSTVLQIIGSAKYFFLLLETVGRKKERKGKKCRYRSKGTLNSSFRCFLAINSFVQQRLHEFRMFFD